VCTLVVASVIGWSAGAVAQPVVHREGEYTGVVPGQKQDGQPRRTLGKATLSWIGFAAKDGGAEVFFQSPSKFEVTQELQGDVLVVTLSDVTRQVSNTRRPIDTRYFDNPLSRISTKPVRRSGKRGTIRGIAVRIEFKNRKDARPGTLRTATEADGMFYAYLSFPEGADAAPAPEDPPDVGSDDEQP
jgi:hypothetical protein